MNIMMEIQCSEKFHPSFLIGMETNTLDELLRHLVYVSLSYSAWHSGCIRAAASETLWWPTVTLSGEFSSTGTSVSLKDSRDLCFSCNAILVLVLGLEEWWG